METPRHVSTLRQPRENCMEFMSWQWHLGFIPATRHLELVRQPPKSLRMNQAFEPVLFSVARSHGKKGECHVKVRLGRSASAVAVWFNSKTPCSGPEDGLLMPTPVQFDQFHVLELTCHRNTQVDRAGGSMSVPNSMLTHISVGNQPSRQPMASFSSPERSSNCSSRAKSFD